MFSPLFSMNIQNLNPPFLIRKSHLNMNLNSSRPQYRLIYQIYPISHTNYKNVFKLLNPINFSQKLVHHRRIYLFIARTSLPTNRINLVNNYTMHLALNTLSILLLPCFRKQIPHRLLRPSNKLTQYLRTLHQFWLHTIILSYKLRYLSSHQCFSRTRWTI